MIINRGPVVVTMCDVCASSRLIQGQSPESPIPASRPALSAIGSPVTVFSYFLHAKWAHDWTRPSPTMFSWSRVENRSVELKTIEWQLQSSIYTVIMVIPPCTEFSPRHHNSVTELVFRSISTTGPACLTVSCCSIVALSSSVPSTFETNSNVAYSRYIIY